MARGSGDTSCVYTFCLKDTKPSLLLCPNYRHAISIYKRNNFSGRKNIIGCKVFKQGNIFGKIYPLRFGKEII